MRGLTAIQAMLLAVISIVLVTLLFMNFQSSFSGVQTSFDPFIRYAKLSETYLKVVSGSYALRGTTLTFFLKVQNTFDEPIYYKSPLYVYATLSGPEGEILIRVPVNNMSPVSFFQPKTIVELVGSTTIDYNYAIVSAYLSINGVPIYFEPERILRSREPDAYCHDCVTCQALIDEWKSRKAGALIALDGNLEVNKDPCIVLSGDGNYLTFDCMGYPVVSSGGTFLEVNGSNYTVQTCVDVNGFSRAVHVVFTSNVTIRTLSTNASDVVYLESPLSPASYDIYLVDVSKGDRKIYQYRSGATTIYPPLLPLAVWVYDYTGPLSLDLNNDPLDSVEPPLAIIGSSSLTVTDTNVSVSYPYAVVVISSSSVTFSNGSISNGSGVCALCVFNSTGVELNGLTISSLSSYDLNISSSDVNLGDLNIG